MSNEKWQLKISHDCVGSGMCAATAPEYFHLVDGYGEPIQGEIAPDEAAVEAAEGCPAGAISVTDAISGRRIDQTP